MIAASARFNHAFTVSSADSFVAFGGLAEKPIRNVRLGRFELFVAGDADVSLHDTRSGIAKATRTLLMRMEKTLARFSPSSYVAKQCGTTPRRSDSGMTASHFNSTSMLRAGGPRAVVSQGEVRLGATIFGDYATRGR